MKKPSAPIMLILALFVSFNVLGVPVLNSFSSATSTIYLDFDGYNVNSAYWNGGTPFTCDPSGMTDNQIIEVFNRVAEDYRPFNINITTDEAKFLAAPLSGRMRVVITPTSSWFPGVGGVSFIGSFTWGDDTPAFVFSDRLGPKSPKMIGECCSHESGHTVGLSHQSKYNGTCNLTATYNDGEGTGVVSWAPIMGNSYYRNMSGWNNGPTPYGCENMQDNLSIITSQNGFSYRTDDHSDDINNNPTVLDLSGGKQEGIITTNADKDAFTFSLIHNSVVHLGIKPFSVNASYEGANLDVKMSLYNSSGVLIKTFDPAAAMDVTVDTILNAGTYFMLIDGTGNSNVDDYGSLGSYTISSSANSMLPIWNARLSGSSDNNQHSLNWDIISNEPLKSMTLEYSADGTHFDMVDSLVSLSNKLVYTPTVKTDLYYRIKLTSVSNEKVYSNVIILKGIGQSSKPFVISTFIHNEISIDAPDDYQYMITDGSGNALGKGNGQAGYNRLNMSEKPAGMYVLRVMSKSRSQTERIIKQ